MENFMPILNDHKLWLNKVIMAKSIGEITEREKLWINNPMCMQFDSAIPENEDYIIYNLLIRQVTFDNTLKRIDNMLCSICFCAKGQLHIHNFGKHYFVCDRCNCGTLITTNNIPEQQPSKDCEFVLYKGTSRERRCTKKAVKGRNTCTRHKNKLSLKDL